MKRNISALLVALALLATAVIIPSCTVPEAVVLPDGTTNIVHKVDPKLETGIAVGRAVNDATASVNPYAPLVSLGFGALAAIAALVARQKGANAAKWEDVATTIIQGVEAAGEAAGPVKQAIEKRSISDGNRLLVDTAVQKELS